MDVCFDSNCFAALIDKATSDLYGLDKTQPIKYAKERLQYFIKSDRPRVFVPTPIHTEILLISSIDKNIFDEFLFGNSDFILAPYDVRAASIHATTEMPRIRNDKRGGRTETMAKLKFDRQILSICKANKINFIFSTDTDFYKDAAFYGITVRCPSTLELPPDIRQPSLELVPKTEPNTNKQK
jgi:hypothetical protein